MLDRRKVAQRKGGSRISVTLGCVAVKQEGDVVLSLMLVCAENIQVLLTHLTCANIGVF
jgi:hypothetical protein